ncbi:hypothetical protein [Actinocorallia populi]|uniref:hypothetical protein n=1 Tax=Actinocorallia populi TaxID=2079200 RepID=UPI000D096463|nr:hypothetical protein [Actinocorallia populi]
MNTRHLQTLAWLIMGSTGSAAGVLGMEGGRLRFEAHGRGALTMGQLRTLEQRTGRPGLADMLTEGHTLVLFDVPLSQVGRVRFPWYYFGGGMKLEVSGVPYRFSFLQPQNTQAAPAHVAGIGAGRAGGRAWKSALTSG